MKKDKKSWTAKIEEKDGLIVFSKDRFLDAILDPLLNPETIRNFKPKKKK